MNRILIFIIWIKTNHFWADGFRRMFATVRLRKFLFPACVQPQTNWGNQIDRKFTSYFIGYCSGVRLHNSSICPIPLRRSGPGTISYTSWTTAVLSEVHAAVLLQFVLSRPALQAEPASLQKAPIQNQFLSGFPHLSRVLRILSQSTAVAVPGHRSARFLLWNVFIFVTRASWMFQREFMTSWYCI